MLATIFWVLVLFIPVLFVLGIIFTIVRIVFWLIMGLFGIEPSYYV